MHFTATLHPDDRASRLGIFQRILAGEIGSFINERRLIRKDGGRRGSGPASRSAASNGRPRKIITFVEDITERKHAEDALRDIGGALPHRSRKR